MPTVTQKSVLVLMFHILFINFFSTSVSQPDMTFPTCDNNANFTTNSTYQTDLDDTLTTLTSDTSITYGFYNQSTGRTPDQVNVIALCRGDVEPADCRSCINDSRIFLRQLCPNQKGAVGWYDDCMLRYSNATLLGILDVLGGGYTWNQNNVSNFKQLYQALSQLLDTLRDEASSGGPLRKYASGNISGPPLTTIYGHMQCTPDLSEDQCYRCLDSAKTQIPCCIGEGRVIHPSCNLRYEVYRFFNKTIVLTPSSTTPTTPTPPSGGSNTMLIVVIIVVSTIGVVVIIVMFSCVLLRRKMRLNKRPSSNKFG